MCDLMKTEQQKWYCSLCFCFKSLFQTCGSKAASPNVDSGPNKRIMLVSEFYYGQFEGDAHKLTRKTNTTFKCRSCLKVLKNNIRYDQVFFWGK